MLCFNEDCVKQNCRVRKISTANPPGQTTIIRFQGCPNYSLATDSCFRGWGRNSQTNSTVTVLAQTPLRLSGVSVGGRSLCTTGCTDSLKMELEENTGAGSVAQMADCLLSTQGAGLSVPGTLSSRYGRGCL